MGLLDDFIDFISDGTQSVFDNSDADDLIDFTGNSDIQFESLNELFQFDNGDNFSSLMKDSIDEQSFYECQIDDVDGSLSDVSFTGHNHHDPFPNEPDYESDHSISFEGNCDKYTDNLYNQEQANKWLAKEQDCLAQGDKSGAAAAHSTAMDHLKRIKSK